jgi:hypothetical protein
MFVICKDDNVSDEFPVLIVFDRKGQWTALRAEVRDSSGHMHRDIRQTELEEEVQNDETLARFLEHIVSVLRGKSEGNVAKKIVVKPGVGGYTCPHPSQNLKEYGDAELCPNCAKAVDNGAEIVRERL